MSKKQPIYSTEFKRKIVELHENGRTISEIQREYDMVKITICSWHARYKANGSFKEVDNLSNEEKELMHLRKENKQLRMEVDCYVLEKENNTCCRDYIIDDAFFIKGFYFY